MSEGSITANFKIRLLECILERGSGDFVVNASTPEAAAAVVLRAYRIARLVDSHLVKLQDGQIQLIERAEELDRQVSFMLLDDMGGEVRPITASSFGSSKNR